VSQKALKLLGVSEEEVTTEQRMEGLHKVQASMEALRAIGDKADALHGEVSSINRRWTSGAFQLTNQQEEEEEEEGEDEDEEDEADDYEQDLFEDDEEEDEDEDGDEDDEPHRGGALLRGEYDEEASAAAFAEAVSAWRAAGDGRSAITRPPAPPPPTPVVRAPAPAAARGAGGGMRQGGRWSHFAEAPSPAAYRGISAADDAMRRAAVESARAAVQAAETGMAAAEAREKAAVGGQQGGTLGMLASAMASAMGVERMTAEAALTAHGGDLEAAMRSLEPPICQATRGRADAAPPPDPLGRANAAIRNAAASSRAFMADDFGVSGLRPPPSSRNNAPSQRVAASAASAVAAASAAGDTRGRELAERAQALAEQRKMAEQLRSLLGSLKDSMAN